MSSSINNETHEKEDSTMEMPKVTVTDAVNILRTMAENLVSTIVRTPYEEKKIRELAEDYMKIAKAVEDMEAAHLTECAQHEDELRKQKSKRITIELPAGYDDALSITACGWVMSENNELPNMMVRVSEVRADLTGHDGDVLVIHPDEDCEWRKTGTEDPWAIMRLLFKVMNENGDAAKTQEQVTESMWALMGGYPACMNCGCSPADWEDGFPPYCHSCGARMANGRK